MKKSIISAILWLTFATVASAAGEAVPDFGDREGCERGDCRPPSATPEPATWALMAAGLCGLAVVARLRKA